MTADTPDPRPVTDEDVALLLKVTGAGYEIVPDEEMARLRALDRPVSPPSELAAGPRCTCKPPDGVTRNHANGCALFDVRAAYRQGLDAAHAAPQADAGLREALRRMDEAEAHNRRLGEEARRLHSGEGLQKWARYDAQADVFKSCAEWVRAALAAASQPSEDGPADGGVGG